MLPAKTWGTSGIIPVPRYQFSPLSYQTARDHYPLRIALEASHEFEFSSTTQNVLLRHARTTPLSARLHGLQYSPATVTIHERRVSELRGVS